MLENLKEFIRNPNAVIGILSGNGLICLAVPVGVVLMKDEMCKALLGIRKHALDIGFGNGDFPCGLNGFTESLIFNGVGFDVDGAVRLGDMAGFQDQVEMPCTDF